MSKLAAACKAGLAMTILAFFMPFEWVSTNKKSLAAKSGHTRFREGIAIDWTKLIVSSIIAHTFGSW